MFLQIAIAIIFGILAGTITGLMPGIHINLVALLLFSASGFLLNYTSAFVLCIFIISMAVTQTFLDFVPSIFLGAPDEETVLSVLPGHELLMKGKGYAAVRLALNGCFYALIVILIAAPFFVFILPKVYPIINQYMGIILIAASVFLVLSEKEKKFISFVLFMLSGMLGIATLNLSVIKQPLFPLLTGLFGTSMLTISFLKNVKVPKQELSKIKINSKEKIKALLASVFSGSLCSFLPGLGASQAAVIGSETAGKLRRESFLFLLGAIGMIVTVLNFVALYAIGKPRSGAAVIVGKLLEELTTANLIYFLLVIFVVGCISYIIGIKCARIFAKNIEKINYRYLCLCIMFLLVVFTILLSGWLGLVVLITANFIGIVSSLTGVKKMHLMGCIMLPVILFFI